MLKSIQVNPEYSPEGLMLRLKLQYFDHLMWTVESPEKMLGKNSLMLGKIEGRRMRVIEDEMVGWHHWINGHEFEQTLWDNEGQESLACWSPWGHKELDTTEQLDNNYIPSVTSIRNYLSHGGGPLVLRSSWYLWECMQAVPVLKVNAKVRTESLSSVKNTTLHIPSFLTTIQKQQSDTSLLLSSLYLFGFPSPSIIFPGYWRV